MARDRSESCFVTAVSWAAAVLRAGVHGCPLQGRGARKAYSRQRSVSCGHGTHTSPFARFAASCCRDSAWERRHQRSVGAGARADLRIAFGPIPSCSAGTTLLSWPRGPCTQWPTQARAQGLHPVGGAGEREPEDAESGGVKLLYCTRPALLRRALDQRGPEQVSAPQRLQ